MQDDLIFSIRSDTAELTLDAPSLETYEAALRAPFLSVKIPVWHFGGDGMGEYFASLARDWRGWEGARVWQSLERQIAFEALMSKAGAVGLRVILSDSSYDAWQIRYELGVDNARLDDIARDALAFERHLGAAR